MDQLQIRTFGEFSFRMGDALVTETGGGSRKAWLLLACLVCFRGQTVSQTRLGELLWPGDTTPEDPGGTLRTTFHRARALLNGLWPNAGHDLLLRREGGFAWNEAYPVTVDADRFEQLCQGEPPLPDLLEALDLYQGGFLPRLSSEPWAIPVQTHFHNLYISATLRACALLAAENRHRETAELCRRAIAQDPYQESVSQWLIRSLAAIGDQKAAQLAYEQLDRRLYDAFGIHPSGETRQVYRQTVTACQQPSLPMDTVLAQLQEPSPIPGAMECDYDHFKILCHAECRSLERSGRPTHVALLAVSAGGEIPLSRSRLNRVMHQLGETIRLNTRRGDVFSRCSESQYILMLPGASYENSCMVCRRVLGAYRHTHPYTNIQLRFIVQPLTPTLRVPR